MRRGLFLLTGVLLGIVLSSQFAEARHRSGRHAHRAYSPSDAIREAAIKCKDNGMPIRAKTAGSGVWVLCTGPHAYPGQYPPQTAAQTLYEAIGSNENQVNNDSFMSTGRTLDDNRAVGSPTCWAWTPPNNPKDSMCASFGAKSNNFVF
jgi:hypothetical protein